MGQRVKLSVATETSSASMASTIDDFSEDKRPIILFDGVCVLCNSAVDFMLQWDGEGEFRLSALQSPAGQRLLLRCGRRAEDISSIVLVEKDKHYIKSESVLRSVLPQVIQLLTTNP